MIVSNVAMKGLILAAGRGSRMGRLTDDRPKGLVEVNGTPLIDWQIGAMHDAGIDEVGIITGYQADLLASRGNRHFHNKDWAITNMVASLRCASEWLETHECIISYSDIIYHYSAINLLLGSDDELAITYDPNWLQLWSLRFSDPLSDAETFKIDTNGMLLDIGGAPKSVDEIQGQYMGLVKVTPRGWTLIIDLLQSMDSKHQSTIHMTDLLREVGRLGRLKVKCFPYHDKWSEVDSTSDLKVASELLRKLRRRY